jgi:vitamin B12 transporter
MIRRCVPFLAFLALLPSAGRAQQLLVFRDTVIVTATGEEQPAEEVAAASSVITASQLWAAGVTSVADALRWVPGVTILRSGLDGGVTSLFVRGTASTQTLVMWDGVRLNSPFFGGYDWSLPLTLGLDRVEIVRGPYSALYGADAIGGVIQLVPEHAGGDRVRTLVEGGGSGWRRGQLDATLAEGSWNAVVSAGSREGEGPLANDGFWSRAGMVEVSTTLRGGGRLGVLLRRTTEHTEIPFSGATLTPHRYTAAEENLIALPLHWRFGTDAELEVTLSRVTRDLVFRDPEEPSGFVRSDTEADSDGARVALHRRWGRHHLVVGGEWREDTVSDGSSYGTNLADRHVATRSLFVQDNWSSRIGIGVLAGVRWDQADPWGSELSPRLTVSWEGRGLRGWISSGLAFRAPSLGELYYPFSGNPALAPERARSGEIGVSVPLVGGRSALQLVAFSNRQSDLIDFDFASFRYANVARAREDGVEASWIAMAGANGHLSVALNWLSARDGNGVPLLRRPTWSGAVTVDGPVWGRLAGAASLVWVGRRADVDPVSLERVRQGGFATADLSATVRLTRALAARVRIENVANRAYEEVRGYPAPERRLILGLEAALGPSIFARRSGSTSPGW